MEVVAEKDSVAATMTQDEIPTREIAESTNSRKQPLQEPLTGVVPTQAFAIQMQPNDGPRRRLRFTERTDGPGWWELEEEWTGCEWRTLGRELLMHVVIEQTGIESK